MIAVIAAAALLISLMALGGAKKKGGGAGGKNPKVQNRSIIIRDCTKKLARDPRNIPALTQLADVYFKEQTYDKAYPLYQSLFQLLAVHTEIDQKTVSSRYAVCAYKIGKSDEAVNGFLKALRSDPKDFMSNLYIGKIMLEKKEYEKSVMCLKRAAALNPESPEINEPMGLAYYHSKKYRESLNYLHRALNEKPDNKEVLFYLASAMDETGNGVKALKIFMHLRPDPVFGAQSCLSAGAIHEKQGQPELAVQDYEIALKLATIPQETKLSILYKLANTCIAQHNISSGLSYLKQIQEITPNYRDVAALISRYAELNQNSNLQAYLMSGTGDFVALCRKFVSGYYPNAFVKIEDVAVEAQFVGILCYVEKAKWEDTELFRFFRSTGSVGELYVRT
ncbi:MAG: restriction endonuclease, partial [Treponemataceae bacterium]|nr:restriction endonuclease [Treponemataceae bacterium]